jgi:hypothetical protein
MSSFLSNKYLQYRNFKGESITISGDRYCIACGYNVRGLKMGQNCPECGTQIRKDVQVDDPLLAGEWSERQQNHVGLALIAFTLIIEAFARLAVAIVLLTGGGSWPSFGWYLWLGLALSGAWAIGVWLLTAARFDSQYRKIKWMRWTARLTSLAFLLAYVLWMLALTKLAGAPGEKFIVGTSVLLRMIGSIGAMFFLIWLLRLASDADLEDAARRIHLAIWMLPLPTIVLFLIPSQIPWIFWFLVSIPLLLWCWYLFVLGRGVLVMKQHVGWSLRIAADHSNRDQRMRETRQELEQEANATVRPVQRGRSDDISLNRERVKPRMNTDKHG